MEVEVCSFLPFFFIFCLFIFLGGSVMGTVNRAHVLLVIGY